MEEPVIPVSVFESKDDNRPVEHRLPWASLADRLCRYEERQTKDGKAWSPVTYKPGTTRGKANVDQVYLLVLDFDHALVDWKLIENFEYVGHTTFQHTREAPRWRIIVLLERPIGGQDWPEFWLRAQAFFGGCVDPATKDSSRIFYLPSCPPGSDHEVCRHHGQPLDPDSLPAVPQYAPTPRVTSEPHAYRRYLGHWAARFCQHLADTLSLMPPESGRNSACNRAAYTLAGLVADEQHDLSVDMITQALFEACLRNRLVEEDGERSVRATIASGIEDGLQRPWSPSDRDPPVPSNVRPFVGRVEQQREPARLGLEVERMSEVRSEPIQWLWRNRLARGKATLLMGDPGLGKSLISHWLAAQVSVGRAWPDEGECERGAALLFTIEDALADTVAPRLEAAAADRSQVLAVRGVVDLDKPLEERLFALEEHIGLLEELVQREHAVLVVMDPVTAYLGPNVNAHKDTDVRRVLAPLQMMAERTGVALLLLMHLTKGSGVAALYRATGSIAFPAVCRVVLGVAPDPNDESGRRRLLLPVKFNIAPEATGIGYHIETTQQRILAHVDERDQPPVIVWDDEPVLVDATSAMDRTGSVEERGSLAECKAVLEQIMTAAGGRITAREGEHQLKEVSAMPSHTTLVRARREIGIKVSKEGYQGQWWWEWAEPKKKFVTRAKADSLDGLDSVESSNPKDANGSERSKESLSLAREALDLRLCPHCETHFTLEGFQNHVLELSKTTPDGMCPVHQRLFEVHECDLL